MEHNPSDMPPHGYYQHHVDVPASMHHDRLDQPQEEGLRKQDHTLVPNLNSRRPGADSMGSVFANASHGLTGDNQRKLAGYWQKTITETENSEHDFKSHALPLARIKKVMKADEDVKMISAEAPIIFAKGCEIFITELTMRAWIHAEENKRRTLQRSDIANAISRSDMFDFLIDIVPREEFVAGSHGVSESNPNAQPVAGAAGGFMGMTLGHAAVQPHPAVQQVPQHVLQDHSRGPVGSPYYSHGPLKPEEPPVNGHYQHHSHMQQQQQQQQQQPLPPQQQRHQSQHPQHPQQHHQPPQQPPQHMYDHNRFMPPVQNMPSMAQQHPAYLDQMGYHQGFNQHNGAPQYSNPYGNPYVNQQQSQQQQSHHVSLLHHHHQQQQQQHGRDGEMEDPSARYGHR